MRSTHRTVILTFVLAMTAIVSGCQQQGKSDAKQEKATKVVADLEHSIGWIHGGCLAIKNKSLADGQKFQMIYLGESQQLHKAKIVRATMSADHCAALKEGRKEINIAQGYSFYEISSTQRNPDGLGLGVIGRPPVLNKSGDVISGDINGDGQSDYFTQCSTSEGVQFNVWSEKIYHQDPIWSGYYYSDYDTVVNCP